MRIAISSRSMPSQTAYCHATGTRRIENRRVLVADGRRRRDDQAIDRQSRLRLPVPLSYHCALNHVVGRDVTHRVAISNRRLISFDETGVTFRYKDYRRDGTDRQRIMTLSPDEFIHRFLLHV